jgi:uracil-DNA glycosylase
MIDNDWDEELKVIWESPNFNKFYKNIMQMYDKETIFPPKDYIFNALKLTPYKDVKVVIVGQDPYHGVGEAHGLSFSVQEGIKTPPSLQNIYKELYNDLGIAPAKTGDLTKWAKEGVLLLNSVLTVKKDSPASHKGLGWEPLTDYIIRKLNSKDTPIVFILWGNFAKSKKYI